MFRKQNKGIKRKVGLITVQIIESMQFYRLCVCFYVSEIVPVKTQPIRGILCQGLQPRPPLHL